MNIQVQISKRNLGKLSFINYFKNREKYWWHFFLFGMAAFYGYISHWKIFEDDIFWRVRSGEEFFSNLITNNPMQFIDRWSSTAFGQKWYDFNWLSDVFFYWIYNFDFDHKYLPTFRALLVFIISLLLLVLIRSISKTTKQKWTASILILPAVYLVSFERFKLAPELISILLFSGIIFKFWLEEKINPKISLLQDLLFLIAWVNLCGETFFIILTWYLFKTLIYKTENSKKAIWILVILACWLITPLHYHGIEGLYDLIPDFISSFNLSNSLDRISDFLDYERFGLGTLIFILLVLEFPFIYAINLKKFPSQLGIFKNKSFAIATYIFFTILSIINFKLRTYALFFMVPFLVVSLTNFSLRTCTVLIATASFCWVSILHEHIKNGPQIGMGISENSYPVYTVKLLNSYKPQGRLLNSMSFGGYLINEARTFPVAQDSRGEILYKDFLKNKNIASSNPLTSKYFIEKNKFSILVLPRPRWEKYLGVGKVGKQIKKSVHGPLDPMQIWYPSKEWAIVAFDEASVLLLRRNSGNDELIQKYEYKYILHGRLPTYSSNEFQGNEEEKEGFRKEILRCRKEAPKNLYCLSSKV